MYYALIGSPPYIETVIKIEKSEAFVDLYYFSARKYCQLLFGQSNHITNDPFGNKLWLSLLELFIMNFYPIPLISI